MTPRLFAASFCFLLVLPATTRAQVVEFDPFRESCPVGTTKGWSTAGQQSCAACAGNAYETDSRAFISTFSSEEDDNWQGIFSASCTACPAGQFPVVNSRGDSCAPCKHASWCLGDGGCAEGHAPTVLGCGTCRGATSRDAGYHKSGPECTPCPSEGELTGDAVLMGFIMTVIGWQIMRKMRRATNAAKDAVNHDDGSERHASHAASGEQHGPTRAQASAFASGQR